MIGETVESRPATPVWAWLFALVAAGLAGLILSQSRHWQNALFAIVPLGMGIGAWCMRERPLRFRVEADRLAFETPDRPDIPFDNLQGLRRDRSRSQRRFSFVIFHRDGALRIPETISVEPRELYEFLDAEVIVDNEVVIPDELAEYWREETEKFGPEKVIVYRAKSLPDPPPKPGVGYGIWIGFGVGALVAGLLAAAIHPDSESQIGGFICGGMFCLLIGVIIALANRGRGAPRRHRDWRRTTLILSPRGLALLQDDMKGKLRWDEILSVEQPPVRRSFQTQTATSGNGIGLGVAGAYIVIKDILDADPAVIAANIRAYWK